MKTIIIDDEKNSLETLELMLTTNCPEVDVIAMCDSPLDGLEQIMTLEPDLIFLDIEMPKLNGFDLLERLGKTEAAIIFITAYNQFAIKAFRISALDYLLKPIDPEELKAAVQKAFSKKTQLSPEQLDVLLTNLRNQAKPTRIALTTFDHLQFVEADNIIYCESDSNYTMVSLIDGEKVIVSRTLKDVEKILEVGFFRIHASFLINLKHVLKYTRGDGGYVMMRDGKHITVSRKKKDIFFELFSRI